MATPLTPDELQVLLGIRRTDVDAALQEVSPAGTRLGIAEIEPIVAASAMDNVAGFAAGTIAYLAAFGLLEQFSAIIAGQTIQAATPEEIANAHIDPAVGTRLFTKTVLARCAIFRGTEFRGTGSLVGPSLVLTCAHVVGAANDDGKIAETHVVLANSQRVGTDDRPVLYSPEADADKVLPLDADDLVYADHNDFVLLRLRVPSGANLSTVGVPDSAWQPTLPATVALLHFPKGADKGVGFGQIEVVTGPRCRWGYNTPTAGGSSGGPCFNTQGDLIGIHQGKRDSNHSLARMVPLELFHQSLAEEVRKDLWPDYLWSLDGRLNGTLVIGRADLFTAFSLMARPGSPSRVLRIRREDPTDPGAGLGYSVELVRKLIERQPIGHRALVLSWPQALFDDFDIVKRLGAVAREQQIAGPTAGDDVAGAAEGQTGHATVVKARVESLLGDLATRAEQRGETIWIVVENANFNLGGQVVSLETLANLVPRWSQLRMVLIGNEAVSLADQEARISDVAAGRQTGLPLVEYLGPFTRSVVEEFLDRVYSDRMCEALSSNQRKVWTNKILAGLTDVNNRYPLTNLHTVSDRMRTLLQANLPDEDEVGS